MNDEIEVRGGSIEEGLANGRKLLDHHPQAALIQAQTLLKLGPDSRALRLAAAAHRKLGEGTEAEAAELAAIQHSLESSPQIKAAARAEHEGRSADASALAARLLAIEPDDLLAMTISAEAALSLRRLPESEQLLRRVLDRAPGFLRASMFLARSLMLQSRTNEAIEVMESAVNRVPGNVPANKFLAQLQAEARDFAGAASTYEKLLGPNDKEPELWVSYGDMLRFLGRRTDSELAYRRAILADGGNGSAWWALASLDAKALNDRDIARMEAALAERSDKPEDAGALHFALGEALDKRARYADAFHHFASGNRLREQAQPYDPFTLTAEVDASIATFTPQFLASRAEAGSSDRSPIFIIGMPRSGSTLVERIIGRHSAVEAAGELPIIPRLVETLSFQGGGVGRYRDVISALVPERIRELADQYLGRGHSFRTSEKPFFTDKLHMNWRHAGLIRLLFPNARMIDVRRNSLDCCWSNYKLLFTRGHPAASNLEHIGRFYADYVRMMDHLEAVAPDSILRVRYEDVVYDIEGETRRLLDFLGLDFEPACIDFHLSTEPVATASSEQVRRPLNREGIGVWKNYEAWLDPLIKALGPLAD